MLRAALALGGTVAGLAALFSFKTHSLAGAAAIEGTNTPMAAASSPMPGAMSSPSMMGGTTGTTGAKSSMMASSAAPRVVTGNVDNTQYGPMQVQLTLTGKHITKVTVVQQTNDGSESNQIDANAIPKLTSETLTAQSAQIDAVSGATYTSAGYKASLQSALDKAMA
jgi:uncharacterized protein with FMN-binding domain